MDYQKLKEANEKFAFEEGKKDADKGHAINVRDSVIREATRWKPSLIANPTDTKDFYSIRTNCRNINLFILDIYAFLHNTRYLTNDEFNSSGLSWSLHHGTYWIMIDKKNFDASEICRRLFHKNVASFVKKFSELGFSNCKAEINSELVFYKYPNFKPDLSIQELKTLCENLWRPLNQNKNMSSSDSSDRFSAQLTQPIQPIAVKRPFVLNMSESSAFSSAKKQAILQ